MDRVRFARASVHFFIVLALCASSMSWRLQANAGDAIVSSSTAKVGGGDAVQQVMGSSRDGLRANRSNIGRGNTSIPSGLEASDWAGIRQAYERHRHEVVPSTGSLNQWHARNPGQQWRTRFDVRGFTVQPDSDAWTWGLTLQRYGVAGTERKVRPEARVRVDGNRVTYTWDSLVDEWFVNDQRGLEHGFTLHQRPTGGNGPVALWLGVRGGLRPHVQPAGHGVIFRDAKGASVVTYTGLTVFDADDRVVPARFEPAGGALRLVVDDRDARYPLTIDPITQQAYLKASNTDANDFFGYPVAVSGDTVVVGASGEASNATGVDGDQTNNSAGRAGAAYVFTRSGGVWSQQAYLKASNTGANDFFGDSVAVSGDTVVVGADGEASNATGVDGDQTNNSAVAAGAAYVFTRSGGVWSQQAYLKASNTGALDQFGVSIAVSGDTVVVGAFGEASNATGVDGDQTNNSAGSAGAAYVFTIGSTDLDPPVIDCAAADGLWHAANVSLACTAEDSGSGLADAGDASFTLETTVANGAQSSNAFTGSRQVCDVAGNCAIAGPIGGNKVDRKAPVVNCATADGLWHADNVSLSCGSSDGGSGLNLPADASFSLSTNLPAGSESANVSTGSYEVCDAVGNCITAGPITGNKVDKKPATISITSPAANATYQLNASIGASYACGDGGSGVASCQGTIGNGSPIDTSSTGTKTFTVTAADNVGNPSTLSVTYSVVSGGGGGQTSADVGVTLSAPARVSPGATLTYAMAVTNGGKVSPATGVLVSDALPAGTVFASASSSQGTITAPAVGSNGTVTVNLGSLAKGATATISVVVTVTAASGTVLTDTATVTATTQDLNSNNNSATRKTTVSKN